MGQLSHRDLKLTQECIRAVYSASDIKAFPGHALSAVSEIIPSIIATYNEVCLSNDKKERSKFVSTPSSVINREAAAAFNRYMHEHPYINFLYPRTMQSHPFRKRIEKFRQTQKIDYNYFPKSRVVKLSDMLTQGQFHRLGIYNEYYRKLDTNYQLILPLFYNRTLLSGFAFNRDKRDFTEKERLILNMLALHMIQAYSNAEAIYEARREAAALKHNLRALEEKLKTGSIKNLKSFGLTPKEAEVLRWLALGKTNADIAFICSITINTVKKHLDRAYRKLGVENRTGASILLHSLKEAR